MATDGLFGHARLDDIAATVLADSPPGAAALVQLLERQHSKLPDDVAIVVAHLA